MTKAAGIGSLIATIATALSAFIAISALVFSLGSRNEALDKQGADIADIRASVAPMPAQIAGLQVSVATLDHRLARVERCMDEHVAASAGPRP